MKEKHIQIRMEQCLSLAKASNCIRMKYGALLISPERNLLLMDGYNGGPRDGSDLCGNDCCIREELKIPSGTQYEKGCVHAEWNVICNSAATGVKTAGAWMIINGEPCELCAKLIHHAGIIKVIVVDGGFMGPNGINYLLEHGIDVEYRAGPQDSRKS